jgi:hypothetical protein
MSPQGGMGGFGGGGSGGAGAGGVGGGAEEVATWGASVGIGQNEWARFLNAVQGPAGVMSS